MQSPHLQNGVPISVDPACLGDEYPEAACLHGFMSLLAGKSGNSITPHPPKQFKTVNWVHPLQEVGLQIRSLEGHTGEAWRLRAIAPTACIFGGLDVWEVP